MFLDVERTLAGPGWPYVTVEVAWCGASGMDEHERNPVLPPPSLPRAVAPTSTSTPEPPDARPRAAFRPPGSWEAFAKA